MKRITVVLVLYFISHSAFAQFEYISPLPGTERQNPETNIIMKNGNVIDAASVQNPGLLQMKGSLSGIHAWHAKLSDDNKTVVIKPVTEFTAGENVVVTVHPELRTKNGQTINGTSFSFKIRNDLSPETQQEMRNDVSAYYLKTFGYDPYRKSTEAVAPNASVVPPPFVINMNTSPTTGTLFYESHQVEGLSQYIYDTYLTRIDNKGHLLWYKDVGDSQGRDFKINANGYLTEYTQFGGWYHILDSNFNKIDSVRCGNGYGTETDDHDFMMYPDGHMFIFALDNEKMDLTQYGGQPNATVSVPIIQELDTNKDVIFQWRSLDYFKVTDANAYVNLQAGTVDPVHTNAIWRDSTDGNIVISNRNMSEITKIDINTGNIIWRWGGKNNQFTFKNDPDAMHFDSQHDVQQIANGDITMFNNANEFPVQQSSAKEYALDEVNKTATYIWSYKHPDVNGVHVFASALGSVQRLSNGNTLIGWGAIVGKSAQTPIPNFTEVNASNQIVWEFTYDSSDENTYRVHRYNWNPCARVTSYTMKTTNITGTGATLKWNSAAGATSYKVRYHRSTYTVWSTVSVSDTTYTLTGLKKNTTYQWEVETVCAKKNNTVQSGSTAPLNFTTKSGNPAADLAMEDAKLIDGNEDDVISIYPLPANDYIDLHFLSVVSGTMEIYDAVGKMIYSDAVNATNGEIKMVDARGWTPGVYLVKIATSDTTIVKKISVE